MHLGTQITSTDTRIAVKAHDRTPLYIRVAGDIEHQIRTGTLRIGERVPSVRAIKRSRQVSTSTALQALLWLENRELIEARPRSGFFVRIPYSDLAPEPLYESRQKATQHPGLDKVLGEVLATAHRNIQLGAAVPTADFFPVCRLNRITRSILRTSPEHSCTYNFPPGSAELRRQIARCASSRQLAEASADDIIVTAGAMEGLALALRAVAQAGDAIAVESPTFFGILQLIRSLGMRAVEIPTDSRHGIILDALESAARKRRIRAAVIISNCHNPLGSVLSEQKKSDLATMAKKHSFPIIEDDLYGDLAFTEPRPRTIKFYDREGVVLLVSSYSKILGPGYRIGWIEPGRWQSKIAQLQFVNTIAAPSLPQQVIAEFLASGGYERHVRRQRRELALRLQLMSRAIATCFPPDSRISRPKGGFLLWVQLPGSVDAMAVYRKALAQEMTIIPGPLFSPSGKFGSYIRLSCGMQWSEEVHRSIEKLGQIVNKCR